MLDRIGVVLIGCGRIARKHLDAIEDDERFELVAACDVDAQARAEVAVSYGVPVFDRVLDALEVEGASLAVLATPSGLHAEQIEAAAARGLNVLCEKPLAIDLDAARGALERADEAGVWVWTVRPLRRWPVHRWVSGLLASGALGAPRLLDARVVWARPQRYYDEAPWRKDPALDGGVLWNQAYHYADLITWWLGAPEAVWSTEATLGLDIGVPDTASVELTYPGATASLRASVLAPGRNLDASLALACERGSVLLGGAACERVERAWIGGELVPEGELDALNARTDEARARGHRDIYAEVAAVCDRARSGERVREPGRLDTIAWLDAARESARARSFVQVPKRLHGDANV